MCLRWKVIKQVTRLLVVPLFLCVLLVLLSLHHITNSYSPFNSLFAATFEDKRKENFDKGAAELERRRQMLKEQQAREAEERAAKEREEAEKRERARWVADIFSW